MVFGSYPPAYESFRVFPKKEKARSPVRIALFLKLGAGVGFETHFYFSFRGEKKGDGANFKQFPA